MKSKAYFENPETREKYFKNTWNYQQGAIFFKKDEIYNLRENLSDFFHKAGWVQCELEFARREKIYRELLSRVKAELEGILPEVYCLYQQLTNQRLDKVKTEDSIVKLKYYRCKTTLLEIERLEKELE
jgi:hypothetical protein